MNEPQPNAPQVMDEYRFKRELRALALRNKEAAFQGVVLKKMTKIELMGLCIFQELVRQQRARADERRIITPAEAMRDAAAAKIARGN